MIDKMLVTYAGVNYSSSNKVSEKIKTLIRTRS